MSCIVEIKQFHIKLSRLIAGSSLEKRRFDLRQAAVIWSRGDWGLSYVLANRYLAMGRDPVSWHDTLKSEINQCWHWMIFLTCVVMPLFGTVTVETIRSGYIYLKHLYRMRIIE